MTVTEARIARLEAEAQWLRSLNVEAGLFEDVARECRSKAARLADEATSERQKANRIAEAADAVRGRAKGNRSLSLRIKALEMEAAELRDAASGDACS